RVAHGADGAHVVARRRFDLDDVGPEVAQHLGGVGPHDDRAQVEDAHAGQRAGRFCKRGHCGWIPASLINLPHRSRCSLTKVAKLSGVPLKASKPRPARRLRISGLATIWLIAALSLATISGGKPAGPK